MLRACSQTGLWGAYSQVPACGMAGRSTEPARLSQHSRCFPAGEEEKETEKDKEGEEEEEEEKEEEEEYKPASVAYISQSTVLPWVLHS